MSLSSLSMNEKHLPRALISWYGQHILQCVKATGPPSTL